MSRNTIDFGIDLGTTNSAIAVLRGTTQDVIKNNLDADITPSAVFIDKRSQLFVGLLAKNAVESVGIQGKKIEVDDIIFEFKRLMGTNRRHRFQTSGMEMLPEELSAEILKSLRDNVMQRMQEPVEAAVITVPAAFEQRQCEATRKAAELIGLKQSPLLQEPVAAALAYGFQSDEEKAYWLVYDFGGGTFDAALIKSEDGTIHVVNHGGDNFLGGADLDWAIIDNLIVPALVKEHRLGAFSRSDPKLRAPFAILKHWVENAKIHLSLSTEKYIECALPIETNTSITVEQRITQSDVARLAEPLIHRSIEICKRVLAEKNLSPSAIRKVILVGGPTKALYFRKMLEHGLGIPLDFSVDPLTVVARGAAVFAGTQRISSANMPKAAAGQFNVELNYSPIGADFDPTVRGTVTSASGLSLEGYTLEVSETTSYWRSGKITLRADGKFKLNLMADKGRQNNFVIELLNTQGTRQITLPGSFTYTIGMTIAEQVLPNSIGVALAGNDTEQFFTKGAPLPAKKMKVFRTAHALRQGQSGEALEIPAVEGENSVGDRNVKLGALEVSGNQIRRDLPAGSEIEVTLHMDESRILRVKAYVPMLDEEFEAVIVHDKRIPEANRLQGELAAEERRLRELREKAATSGDPSMTRLLDEVEHTHRTELRPMVQTAISDPVAAQKAERRLLEAKIKLDQVEEITKWPALVVEAREKMADLMEKIQAHGTPEQAQKAADIKREMERAISEKRYDALKKKADEAQSLSHDILIEQPGFWVGFFQYLEKQRHRMTDAAQAERLIRQGQQFLATNNLNGLRSTVVQILDILPQEVANEIQRGYESGIIN